MPCWKTTPAEVAVAATTVWEIAIKTARGKLSDIRVGAHASLAGMLQAHGFTLLAFDAATAEHAANLPPFHADPFDRALVAVAQRSGRTVLTSDAMIARYGVAGAMVRCGRTTAREARRPATSRALLEPSRPRAVRRPRYADSAEISQS